MKKLICAVALLALPTVAAAQLPEPVEGLANPLVLAGASYLNEKPLDGSSQTKFFMTANVAGIKPFSGVPLYVGGVGIDIRTLPGIGELAAASGAGLSIPGLTYAFANSQAVVQVGYSLGFDAQKQSSGVYAGFGFSLASPATLKAKRLKKQEEKAKKAAHLALPANSGNQ
jgi:hypothetical protein